MSFGNSLTRRSFLATTAAAASALGATNVPVGLELYSVRTELSNDLMGTVRAVSKLGYAGHEFYGPYFEWTPDYAKQVRSLLDELKVKCFSTHNDARNFTEENLPKAIELNRILGSKYIVMASAGRVNGLDGWKGVADTLAKAAAKTKSHGMAVGFHNHQTEFKETEGKRPMDILASNTPKDVVLQLDVGTCLEAGQDPVAWINANPGRIKSMHCKDWSKEKGYKVLFGEGSAPWKEIFRAAETKGGIEYYLIEQEEYSLPPVETVQRCLENFKKLHS